MRARHLISSVALATAAVLGASGTAQAQTPIPRVYTVAEGGLGCAGWIDFRVIPGPHPWVMPGEARVLLTGTFYGIDVPPTVPTCSIGANVIWRNLDTGAKGTTIWAVVRSAGGTPGWEVGLTIPSGPGRVTATLNTNALHLPSTVEFTVG
jgi:hypothetical protein